MVPTQAKLPAPPHGIVASLAAGFEAVNTRLELILLPLALDLFLWLGPHLSMRPLVEQLATTMLQLAGSDPALRAQVESLQPALADYAATFNLFSALSTAPLGVPSLAAGARPASTPLGASLLWYLSGDGAGLLGAYLLLRVGLTLVGLFLAAVYLGGIAQQVRDRRVRLGLLARQVWGDWARLTALGLLALLVVAVLGLPVLILSVLLVGISPVVGLVAWIGGTTVILWVLFYGGFAMHGMLLQRRGLFGALWDSARLIQVNLPHAAGLFVVIVLINTGLGLVWNLPSGNSWLWLVGLGGHALISTALMSATFVFYQDRYRWWVEMRQALRAQAEGEARRMRPRV